MYMDRLNDIHLLPDSMIYIGGNGGRGFCTVYLGSGELKLDDTLINTCTFAKILKASVCWAGLVVMSLVQFPGWFGAVRVSAVADLDRNGATVVAEVWGLVSLVFFTPASALPSTLYIPHILFSHPQDYTQLR